MRVLLDTHIFVWAIAGNRRLSSSARRYLNAAEVVFVSAASIWEVAVKARLGKIDSDPEELAEAIDASGFIELPVTSRHAAAVSKLPLHHQDPFDRLLLAQALTEPLRLITADESLKAYGAMVDHVDQLQR